MDGPFTKQEYEAARRRRKPRKDGGPFDNPSEVVKEMGEEDHAAVLAIFNECFDKGFVPQEWRQVDICMVEKKGDVRFAEFWRTLAMTDPEGKTLEDMMQARYRHLLTINPDFVYIDQFGFLTCCSLDDALLISNMAAMSAIEGRLMLYCIYIDFIKAYDRVSRRILWQILEARGTPPKLLALTKAFYVDVMARLRSPVDGTLSEPFPMAEGLKEGSPLSPLLYDIFLSGVLEPVREAFLRDPTLGANIIVRHKGRVWFLKDLLNPADCTTERLFMILFADDCELLALSQEAAQKMVDIFCDQTLACGQLVSPTKTFVMVVHHNKDFVAEEQKRVVFYQGRPEQFTSLIVKDEKSFNYLGRPANRHATLDHTIRVRRGRMMVGFMAAMFTCFLNNSITLADRYVQFQAMVYQAGLHGCTSWNATQQQINLLEQQQFQLLRRMVPGAHKMSSVEHVIILAAQLGVMILPLQYLYYVRLLRYLGHVHRLDPTRLQRIVLHGKIETPNKPGRGPAPTNIRTVLVAATKALGIPIETWEQQASNKKAWQQVLDDGAIPFMVKFLESRQRANHTSQLQRATSVYEEGVRTYEVARAQGVPPPTHNGTR